MTAANAMLAISRQESTVSRFRFCIGNASRSLSVEAASQSATEISFLVRIDTVDHILMLGWKSGDPQSVVLYGFPSFLSVSFLSVSFFSGSFLVDNSTVPSMPDSTSLISITATAVPVMVWLVTILLTSPRPRT